MSYNLMFFLYDLHYNILIRLIPRIGFYKSNRLYSTFFTDPNPTSIAIQILRIKGGLTAGMRYSGRPRGWRGGRVAVSFT
jgi:hypothetical protein